MFKIEKATVKDAAILSIIGKTAFLEAHGHSASKEDIENYVSNNFTEENFRKELENPQFIFHKIYVDDTIAGYSKIVLNAKNAAIPNENNTNLSRLYLLKEFYGLNLGVELFNFNVNLSKENNQKRNVVICLGRKPKSHKFLSKNGFCKSR